MDNGQRTAQYNAQKEVISMPAKSRRTLIIRAAAGTLVLIWVFIIFSFSSQEAVQSSALSKEVGKKIIETLDRLLHFELTESQILKLSSSINYIVRKSAHMTEYALLAVLIYVWFGALERITAIKFLLSWFCCVFYAATDEWHQTFVDGRSGQIKDVMIDGAGAVIGLIAATLCIALVNKIWRSIWAKRNKAAWEHYVKVSHRKE